MQDDSYRSRRLPLLLEESIHEYLGSLCPNCYQREIDAIGRALLTDGSSLGMSSQMSISDGSSDPGHEADVESLYSDDNDSESTDWSSDAVGEWGVHTPGTDTENEMLSTVDPLSDSENRDSSLWSWSGDPSRQVQDNQVMQQWVGHVVSQTQGSDASAFHGQERPNRSLWPSSDEETSDESGSGTEPFYESYSSDSC